MSSVPCRLWRVVLAPLVFFAACGHDNTVEPQHSDLLVILGDSALYEHEVVARIPVGIAPGDSAQLFASVVDAWIEDQLLMQVALDHLSDADEIERLVEQYRRELILSRYLSRVRESGRGHVDEKDVRAYYARHSGEMLTERPLVRGAYLKVSAREPKLDRLRKWMTEASPRTFENIEKHGLDHAQEYDYFGDRWVDWQTVARQIPYRFYDAEAFLKANTDFETSYGDWVYLLHIADYLPAGSVMPYEFARAQITDWLEQQVMRETERRFVQRLVNQALDDHVLRGIGYDPVSHRCLTQ